MVEVQIVFIVDQDLTVSATNPLTGLCYSSSIASDQLPPSMQAAVEPRMTFWVELAEDGTPMVFDERANEWVLAPAFNIQPKWFDVAPQQLAKEM